MKSYFFTLVALVLMQQANAQNYYKYSVDLINVKNDQVAVELNVPAINEEIVTFSFPKAIPGSYARKNFGRFIAQFSAYNKDGKKLKVEKLNANQYQINDAKNLAVIKYKVNDTWDNVHKDFIFQPGGTNIDAGENFVINNHAFYGYFEEYKSLPIEIEVKKPSHLFGATHLRKEKKSAELDILKASSYIQLADNPVVYAAPDTTSFYMGKARINIFVYSATGKVKSAKIAEILKPMVMAMDKFFNPLPVSSYQFLFYFEDPGKGLTNRKKGEGGYGALEHNYSSLYYLPERSFVTALRSMVLDVSAHEFLHILTPLNLHSAEIGEFDFTSPKMSQHLWLYEGVTEYFSHLAQLEHKLIDEKKFIEEMQSKISQAQEFGDFSLTEMSARVMEDEFQKKYGSVYNRGALLAFFLDLEIREKTLNSKDLKSVIQKLAQKYGAQKSFEDSTFFEELISESHPDIKSFIDTYIKGNSQIPLTEYFGKIGYVCIPSKRIDGYFAGKLDKKFDEVLNSTVFTGVEENILGIENGDVLVKIQDVVITPENIEELWEKYISVNLNAPELYVTVKRNGVEKLLSASLYRGYMKVTNYLEPLQNKTEQQVNTLKNLMN